MSGDIALLLSEGDQTSPHVERAIERAVEDDLTVHGVYVIEAWYFGEYSVYGWEELTREIHDDKSEQVLGDIAARCDAYGIDFESTVVEGKPCKAVETYATANDIDCVICGRPDGSGQKAKSPKMLDRLDEGPCRRVEIV